MLETLCREILFVSHRSLVSLFIIISSVNNAKYARASNYFQNEPNNWNLLRKVSHGRNGRNLRTNLTLILKKLQKKGTVSDLINHISKMRKKLVTHSEIKQNQSKAFKGNLEQSKIDPSAAVLQIDWAENYKCFTQNKA